MRTLCSLFHLNPYGSASLSFLLFSQMEEVQDSNQQMLVESHLCFFFFPVCLILHPMMEVIRPDLQYREITCILKLKVRQELLVRLNRRHPREGCMRKGVICMICTVP